MLEVGDWIEYNDRIYEIIRIHETEYEVKEVLYKDITRFRLKYGGVFFIGKALINGSNI